jgi:DNA-binding transcriptional ArsR family regulator
MDDLLKEAIADAKAVRETALENAKMALEEAFTPKLQSMLSKKIQMEMDDEEMEEDEMPAEEEPLVAQDEDPADEFSEDEMPAEPEMEEEGVIEINGVKYAPVVSEEEEEEMEEGDEEAEMEEDDQEDDLDLEAVIKELEDELEESENPYDGDEQHQDYKKVSEQSDSSDIGKADNKVDVADAKDEEDPQGAKLTEEDDIDLDEVLKALSEEEDAEEEVDEVSKLRSDLDEHRSVITTLREKLNEVNLLNAKLLFTNKLFRKYGLNNEQKMKVVEQFDRAVTLREVKLVYSTLGESFGVARNKINESKGSASKSIASTKPEKKVISESSDLRDRFKKLANIL